MRPSNCSCKTFLTHLLCFCPSYTLHYRTFFSRKFVRLQTRVAARPRTLSQLPLSPSPFSLPISLSLPLHNLFDLFFCCLLNNLTVATSSTRLDSLPHSQTMSKSENPIRNPAAFYVQVVGGHYSIKANYYFLLFIMQIVLCRAAGQGGGRGAPTFIWPCVRHSSPSLPRPLADPRPVYLLMSQKLINVYFVCRLTHAKFLARFSGER